MAEDLNFSKLRRTFSAPDAPACVTAVVQDADNGEVLMVGHANLEAVRHIIETRQLTLWSTSRKELWVKGLTSGNTFEVVEVRVDCDGDAILLKARGAGPMCHTGTRSCFSDDKRNLKIELQTPPEGGTTSAT
ncbi:MAG: phosphoribosyl-AMP cyclohydrolase [Candidatus Sumerlaeota bacterium]|nr:phosphoribosyl-AMP cyclohydrolase [Candidatus Sumerlaeota bacterium]